MKTVDEIKQLMAAGETAEADAALKELLAKRPNNFQVKMLYGTCRQLLGDEATFKRIHDELAPMMERLEKAGHGTKTVLTTSRDRVDSFRLLTAFCGIIGGVLKEELSCHLV